MFGVHSRHVIRRLLLHYAVFCLANVNINTLSAYFYGIWKVSFSQESMFWCLYVYLIPYIHQRPKPDGYKWRLSFIHYRCVSCHSSSVFGRNIWLHYEYDWTFVYLHIVKSTPNNQTWKKKSGFLDLYSDVNATYYVSICFHLVAWNVALKWRFGISLHALTTQ